MIYKMKRQNGQEYSLKCDSCTQHAHAQNFDKVIKINHSNDNRVKQPPYNKRNEYSLDKNRIKKYRTGKYECRWNISKKDNEPFLCVGYLCENTTTMTTTDVSTTNI